VEDTRKLQIPGDLPKGRVPAEHFVAAKTRQRYDDSALSRRPSDDKRVDAID
jgi:hypothetical protein